MLDERDELTRKFAETANGYQRDHVVNAGGVMILNALRQSHATLAEAERELEDVVGRMRAVLRERHYDSGGWRRTTHIVVDPPKELVEALRIN